MIGLSPALDFWNGGADLATRSARISSLGGGNTEYILIPGGKLPDSTDDQKRHAKHREGKPAKKHEAQWSGATASSSMIQTVLPHSLRAAHGRSMSGPMNRRT